MINSINNQLKPSAFQNKLAVALERELSAALGGKGGGNKCPATCGGGSPKSGIVSEPAINSGQTPTQSSADLSSLLKKYSGKGQKINEEQMFAAATDQLLGKLSPDAQNKFQTVYQKQLAKTGSSETATNLAMRRVIRSKMITRTEGKEVTGAAFKMAQLDNNKSALFDGQGGSGDQTVATARLSRAEKLLTNRMERYEAGNYQVTAMRVQTAKHQGAGATASTQGMSTPLSQASYGGEFLWKPQSESDGKLVVLLPSQFSGQVVSAGVYSDTPAAGGRLIEQGDFAGDSHNGGRAHFRFDRSGGAYPDGSLVLAQLRNGQTHSFRIGESSSRNTL